MVDGNTIERVARGMVIDHITGRMTVSENAMVEPDGVGVALRYPGSGVSLTKNGVVGPGGRGYDLGLPRRQIRRSLWSRIRSAARCGRVSTCARGGWHLDPDGEHRCELRLGFRGGRRQRR